jgi:hypothetical protein
LEQRLPDPVQVQNDHVDPVDVLLRNRQRDRRQDRHIVPVERLVDELHETFKHAVVFRVDGLKSQHFFYVGILQRTDKANSSVVLVICWPSHG